MAFPKITLQQLGSFLYLVDLIWNDPDSVSLDTEAFSLGKPFTLISLLFLLKRKKYIEDGNLIVVFV